METFNSKIEHEPAPKDVSTEFLSMSPFEFMDFLRTQRQEPALSITIDWVDGQAARRLKAFLEDSSALGKQKRSATIKATKNNMNKN